MSGLAIIITSVVCFAGGYLLNRDFQEKYQESGIVWPPCIVQCICVFLVLITLPSDSDEPSAWFIIFLLCAIVSYIWGILSCRNHARGLSADDAGIVKALIAQAMLPFGIALIIMIFLALTVGQKDRRRRRRK